MKKILVVLLSAVFMMTACDSVQEVVDQFTVTDAMDAFGEEVANMDKFYYEQNGAEYEYSVIYHDSENLRVETFDIVNSRVNHLYEVRDGQYTISGYWDDNTMYNYNSASSLDEDHQWILDFSVQDLEDTFDIIEALDSTVYESFSTAYERDSIENVDGYYVSKGQTVDGSDFVSKLQEDGLSFEDDIVGVYFEYVEFDESKIPEL